VKAVCAFREIIFSSLLSKAKNWVLSNWWFKHSPA